MSRNSFRTKEFGIGNSRVLFLFAGMGTRIGLYKPMIKKLVKNDHRVVAYDFDPMVVRNGDPDDYLELGRAVMTDISERLDTFKAEGVSCFSSFGSSMGTLMAIKSAALYPEISKLVINLTYGSVAENIWTWWFIRPAKKRAIALGYTLDSLEKKLAPISPIPSAPDLSGTDVLLYQSRNDKVLLIEQTDQFRAALDISNVEYEHYLNSKNGHFVSAYKNLLNSDIWLQFLDKA
jgi:pimeloyl-ACP methyl ester carboxylesterase